VNYKQLVAIHAKYKSQKLSILGFPCNQFGNQEPGSNADIKKFAEKYGVQFDMFEKINVNGGNAHPVFRFLKANTSSMFGSFIKWNFSKFLVNRAGKPVERFAPPTHPDKLVPQIEKLLKEPAPAVAVVVAAAAAPAMSAAPTPAGPVVASAAAAAVPAPVPAKN